MLKPKEEAQSIKRVETINIGDIKKITTCDDLIQVCIDIIENININVADFIVKNKIYGYSQKIDLNKSLENIIYLKQNIIKKRVVTNDLESVGDIILDFNKENELANVIALLGTYYMYKGNFSYALSLISYARSISSVEINIVTDIEYLNEFIFKYNLSIDITKLGNYKEACSNLQSYYDKNIRIDRGDQLLIIIYEYLNKTNKSEKILDSIYNICNNALFHYELRNRGIFSRNKTHFIIGMSILTAVIIGIVFVPKISLNFGKVEQASVEKVDKTLSDNSLKQTGSKEVETSKKEEPVKQETIKEEPKKEIEPEKSEVKALDISSLENMINNLSVDNTKTIEEQFKMVNLNDKDIKKYEDLKKKYSSKKQKLYYDLGREKYKNGNVDESIEYLTLAYNEKTEEYVEPHVIYHLASAVSKKEPEKSIKYFKEYLKKYKDKDGSYTEEAIYNIANIYWNLNNKKEAKKYASKLKYDYSKSIYNNKKISEILS